MKPFLTLLLLPLWLGQALAVSLADLNGTWVIHSVQAGGIPVEDDTVRQAEMDLKDGSYHFRTPASEARGTVKIDNSSNPASMDVTETEGSNVGRRLLAVFEMTANGWRANYDFQGASRPASFQSGADNGYVLVEYRRKPGTAPPTPKPLKALLITGGCCHEYDRQAVTLMEGLSRRARVDFTLVRDAGADGTQHQVSAYRRDDWAAGYDLVVHNECYADEKDPAWLERIVKPHREGVPSVVIHCAMHCYRAPSPEWFRFVGVTSRRHGSHFAYPMANVRPEHPVMKGFPAVWQTPKEELYHIESVEKTVTALATGFSHETQRGEVNAWVNLYGPNKTRVFGTTVGHYDQTLREPVFLDLVARGLLWAAGRLGDDGQPVAGYGPR
ncbi:MAG: ThuA domain-containing protein [Verrucomicrobiota bacterium]